MSTRIKICGLRRPDDVECCLELGVEFVGFNCWPQSPRYASPDALRSCLARMSALDSRAEGVLVFVNPQPTEISELLDRLDFSGARLWIQLHGDEAPADYPNLGVPVIRTLRLPIDGAHPCPIARDTRVLVEARHPRFGGSGHCVDPSLVEGIRSSLPTEWLLAGGLTPTNVAGAIDRLRPWGVDVASGVETAPGEKDPVRLRAFVEAVRARG